MAKFTKDELHGLKKHGDAAKTKDAFPTAKIESAINEVEKVKNLVKSLNVGALSETKMDQRKAIASIDEASKLLNGIVKMLKTL